MHKLELIDMHGFHDHLLVHVLVLVHNIVYMHHSIFLRRCKEDPISLWVKNLECLDAITDQWLI